LFLHINTQRTAQQIRRACEVRNSIRRDPEMLRAFDAVLQTYDLSYTQRWAVSDLLFRNAILSNGTAEQYEKYDVGLVVSQCDTWARLVAKVTMLNIVFVCIICCFLGLDHHW